MQIAETERLVLRRFAPADAPALGAIMADPEVMRFSSTGPLDAAAVDAMLQRIFTSYAERGFGHWAVVRWEDQRLLGFCGLSVQTLDDGPHVEVGYRLARDVWGRGYATEAALASRDYAFRDLGLARLIAIIDPANTASQRVAIKLGMEYERDTIYMGIAVRVYASCQSALNTVLPRI